MKCFLCDTCISGLNKAFSRGKRVFCSMKCLHKQDKIGYCGKYKKDTPKPTTRYRRFDVAGIK
jgi:hypothetical protein